MQTQVPIAGADGSTVPVAGTDTVIVAPFDVRTLGVEVSPYGASQRPAVAISLSNDDGSQTLNAWVEVAPTASGPWMRSSWAAFETMAAGATRSDVFASAGYQWVRLVGLMDGAGGNTRVWAWKVLP